MRKVFWSKMAINDYDKNIDFLKDHWNDKTIFDFLEKTGKVIELIVQNPSIGAWEESIGCHRILVTKHIYFI